MHRYTYSRLYVIIYDHGFRLVTIGNTYELSTLQLTSGQVVFCEHFYLLELWINLYSLYFQHREGSRQYTLPSFHLFGVSFLL